MKKLFLKPKVCVCVRTCMQGGGGGGQLSVFKYNINNCLILISFEVKIAYMQDMICALYKLYILI